MAYVTGFFGANQITIPDVESEVQAKMRVREQIHSGAEGKILANSTALGNLSLLMFLTTKESKSRFRAGSMHWLRIHSVVRGGPDLFGSVKVLVSLVVVPFRRIVCGVRKPNGLTLTSLLVSNVSGGAGR